MSRIGRNWTTVVTPVIDVIMDDSLEYTYSSFVAVGGFDWNLQVANVHVANCGAILHQLL